MTVSPFQIGQEVQKSLEFWAVLEKVPRKQGLKLGSSRPTRVLTFVLEKVPRKQGLKLYSHGSTSSKT